jgi:SAM-dependent methyltransferase
MPLADDSVDLVLSNLMLHWHPQPHQVLPEWKRVLRADGLLMFSCFGPDTLKELRAAAADALPQARPMPFVDMHDFGDMMVASGFATPVMDVEADLTHSSAGAAHRGWHWRQPRSDRGRPAFDTTGTLAALGAGSAPRRRRPDSANL